MKNLHAIKRICFLQLTELASRVEIDIGASHHQQISIEVERTGCLRAEKQKIGNTITDCFIYLFTCLTIARTLQIIWNGSNKSPQGEKKKKKRECVCVYEAIICCRG
jgi:hypothetical protein